MLVGLCIFSFCQIFIIYFLIFFISAFTGCVHASHLHSSKTGGHQGVQPRPPKSAFLNCSPRRGHWQEDSIASEVDLIKNVQSRLVFAFCIALFSVNVYNCEWLMPTHSPYCSIFAHFTPMAPPPSLLPPPCPLRLSFFPLPPLPFPPPFLYRPPPFLHPSSPLPSPFPPPSFPFLPLPLPFHLPPFPPSFPFLPSPGRNLVQVHLEGWMLLCIQSLKIQLQLHIGSTAGLHF